MADKYPSRFEAVSPDTLAVTRVRFDSIRVESPPGKLLDENRWGMKIPEDALFDAVNPYERGQKIEYLVRSKLKHESPSCAKCDQLQLDAERDLLTRREKVVASCKHSQCTAKRIYDDGYPAEYTIVGEPVSKAHFDELMRKPVTLDEFSKEYMTEFKERKTADFKLGPERHWRAKAEAARKKAEIVERSSVLDSLIKSADEYIPVRPQKASADTPSIGSDDAW
jgi:hypothetical protein